ncbi:MAG: hypothetical protein RBT41_07875 [Clostridia bacterium]|jgi:hypothetical protein|nr:hypothetical protein [Clostridia bacterium]
MTERIIAYVDKTVVKITGLKIKGMKPVELEKALQEKLGRPARVIGVTSSSLQLDVYGLEPEAILGDEQGIITAISLTEGVTAAEVARIDTAEKALEADVDLLAQGPVSACPKERWLP